MKKTTLFLNLLLTVALNGTVFAAGHGKEIQAGFIYV